ncbi:DUF2169 family type VI secretion system accessory protein [Mangrovicoccus algicola]|uniref:Uncharacterized protein n=1 Tax=Mangrovicoccus algicola TaxID=2771008 RepID=A0A8J7CHM5_9RHOB|nr:hypothetical protein [Mangrovicoccus algicola]MBE3638370.1 hypothetical protein [Mangrovicoccus algicola]
MRVELPSGRPFGAALAMGTGLRGGAEAMLAAVVVKAAYDLVPDGTGPRRMQPAADPQRSAPRLTGASGSYQHDGDTRIDLIAAPDIAIEKARTDILVEGFPSPAPALPCEASVTVDGQIWLRRGLGATRGPDLARNLFGRLPPGEGHRDITVPADFVPAPGDLLPAAHSPLFENLYRDADGFTAWPARLSAPLPPGATVAVHLTADASDPGYALRLPATRLAARYRVWCGHGPDRPRHWRIGTIGPLAADTLILRPALHQAEILWRAAWPWAAEPPAHYRSVQILEVT